MATTVVITSGTTFTVPANFQSLVSIEAIGGGGGGANGTYATNFGQGGGGGAYSKITSLSGVAPGNIYNIQIGSGGAGSVTSGTSGGSGGDTWFNSTSTLLAKGGSGGPGNSSTGGAGGASSSCVGSLSYSGGKGGNASANFAGGGGGGAAGPNGAGGNGGDGGQSNQDGGGGGGGNGGGTAGQPNTSSNGGNGGNNASGTGGGVGTSSTSNPGTNGGGGSGGPNVSGIPSSGGAGGSGIEWSTAGSGGGGGGAGASGTPAKGGNGGNYGGGGGGGGYSSGNGGNGAQGVIVFTYVAAPTNYTENRSDTFAISSSVAQQLARTTNQSDTTVKSQTWTPSQTLLATSHSSDIISTFSDIQTSTYRHTYEAVVLNDGPTAYYRMDDTTSTALNYGSGGSTLNGTVGTGITEGVTGLLVGDSDAAMSFPGGAYNANNHIVVAKNIAIEPTAAVSVEFLVNLVALPADPNNWIACGRASTGGTYGYAVYQNTSGKLTFAVSNGSGSVTSNTALAAGTTYHIVCVYDGNNLYIYVNGVVDNTAVHAGTITGYDASDGLVIGEHYASQLDSIHGTLDEIAIYTTALNSGQVKVHYETSSATQNVFYAAPSDVAIKNQTWTPSQTLLATNKPGDTVANPTAAVGPNLVATNKPSDQTTHFNDLTNIGLVKVINDAFNFVESTHLNQLVQANLTQSGGSKSNYSSTVLGDSPALYYRLNDSGTTAVNSGSLGTTYNGSVGSGVTEGVTGLVTGDSDTAMTFPGTAYSAGVSSITTSRISSIELASGFSVEAIVNLATVGSTDKVTLASYGDTSVLPWILQMKNSKFLFTIRTSGAAHPVSSAVLTPGTYHVVGTYDGSTLCVYVNGVQYSTALAVAPTYDTTGSFIIGSAPLAANTETATIDEVAFYPTALTQSQVTNHYNALTPVSSGMSDSTTTNQTKNVSTSDVFTFTNSVAQNIFATCVPGAIVVKPWVDTLTQILAATVVPGAVVVKPWVDSTGVTQSRGANLSDSLMTLATALAQTVTQTSKPSDTAANHVDSATVRTIQTYQGSDTVAHTGDSVSAFHGFMASASDRITNFLGVLTTAGLLKTAISDVFTFVDSLSSYKGGMEQRSDRVATLSDAVQAKLTAITSLTNAMSFLDSLKAQLVASTPLSQSMPMSNGLTQHIQASTSAADTMHFGDQTKATQNVTAHNSDAFTFLASLVQHVINSANVSQTSLFNDITTANTIQKATTSDALAFVDALKIQLQAITHEVDSITFHDTVSSDFTTLATLLGSVVTFGDATTVTEDMSAHLTDSWRMSDSVVSTFLLRFLQLLLKAPLFGDLTLNAPMAQQIELKAPLINISTEVVPMLDELTLKAPMFGVLILPSIIQEV